MKRGIQTKKKQAALRPKGEKGKKLSNKIAVISGGVLVIVFAVMIVVSVSMSQRTLEASIESEFQSVAETTALKTKQILEKAESTTSDISLYLQRAYEMSAKGKRNLLGQDFRPGENADAMIQAGMFNSVIYNVPLSEMSMDVEKYMIETARNVVKQNEDIEGVGVYFEPYAFDSQIRDYAFYIQEGTEDKPITPYGQYETYSKERHYAAALNAGKPVFTDPYDYEGIQMVSATVPVFVDGNLKCVVSVEIDITDFQKVCNLLEGYSSMFTTIINANQTVVFDSESIDFVGSSLNDFFPRTEEYNQAISGITAGQKFSVTNQEDNRVVEVFFNPLESNGETWWALTALSHDEMKRPAVVSGITQVVISVIALLIVTSFLATLLRRMLKPIEEIAFAAERISDGDLGVAIAAKSNDEIGRLATSFSKTISRLKAIINDTSYMLGAMAEGNFDVHSKAEDSYVGDFGALSDSIKTINTRLTETLTQINVTADQVSSGSEQVSSGAQALSQGATEQASSIEELAATINDISAQVQTNANNAQDASEKSNAVSAAMIESNQQMHQMIASMDEIGQSSSEIGKIIKTIEDIAFQTNILALNAAVEAARAGEAGKGFAVVADEVRNLASKSAEASQNTATLIEHSIQTVEKGKNIADSAAASIESVVQEVQDAANYVNRISEASQSQAAAINQVTQGIDQIASVVQTNSATAEESAASSEELSSQAQVLKDLVGSFQLKKL